jgi:hypothetical protein
MCGAAMVKLKALVKTWIFGEQKINEERKRV